jgi:hypothetical protein
LFPFVSFCLLLFPFVYFCFLLFTFVYFCLLLFTFVYFCLLLFTFVNFCLLLFTFVYFCLLLFTFVYFCFFFQSARDVAVRLLMLIIIWFVGWTPFAVVSSIQLLGYGKYINKNINVSAMMFCKVSSILNIGMYGMRFVCLFVTPEGIQI